MVTKETKAKVEAFIEEMKDYVHEGSEVLVTVCSWTAFGILCIGAIPIWLIGFIKISLFPRKKVT